MAGASTASHPRRGAAFGALLVALACGRDDEAPGEREAAAADGARADAPSAVAPFTIRGRWDEAPERITVRIETDGAPLPGDDVRAAVERCLEAWATTGAVGFAMAEDAAPADVTYRFHGPGAEGCPPPGHDGSVAHAGPVGAPTWVHFDARHPWTADGPPDRSLLVAALHETGHVLGLGHSPDVGAVMHHDSASAPEAPTPADRAGLHSLYGGGPDGDDDLLVLCGEGAAGTKAVLRGVAPPGRADVTPFDTNGDGRDELLVWRTDPEGAGALLVYFFAPGPRLCETEGPFYGLVAPGRSPRFAVTASGERVLVDTHGGRLRALRFTGGGALEPCPRKMPLVVDGEELDADDDGLLDVPWEPLPDGGRRTGDLDGDGRRELVALRWE